MELQKQNQLIEDVSYLRGRLDTIIPVLMKQNDDTNKLLMAHTKDIEENKNETLAIKVKVGIYAGIAGFAGGGIVTLALGIFQHFLTARI